MNSAAAQSGVDLDDAGALGGALALDVQHASRKTERLDRLHREFHELTDRLGTMVGRAVQAGFLKRGLRRRPVLGDAREDALAVFEDEVDVELDAVDVFLEKEIVARTEID